MSKTKNIIAAVIIALAAYMAGALFGIPFAEDALLSGDVQKARLYNGAMPDIGDNTSVESLRSDTTYRQRLLTTLFVINERISVADSLAQATLSATEGVEQLRALHDRMTQLQNKTDNAHQLLANLFAETDKVLSGAASDYYDPMLNSLGMAYTTIAGETALCTEYIALLSAYGKERNDAKTLAAAAGWLKYGAENALLSSEKDAAAWKDVYAAAKAEAALGARFVSFKYPTPSSLLERIRIAGNNVKILDMAKNVNINAQSWIFAPRRTASGDIANAGASELGGFPESLDKAKGAAPIAKLWFWL